MFEFVCDHVVPGCTHRETGDTKERAMEKAREHLNEHHGMEYLDSNTTHLLETLAIQRVIAR